MNRQMSIEELAEEANKVISLNPSVISDKRITDTISVRRIRDYISKGMMDKPYKDGRNTYYVQRHLDQLLTLREYQHDGLSESYIQKLSTSTNSSDHISESSSSLFLNASASAFSVSSQDDVLQQNALSLLAGMKQNLSIGSSPLESARSATNSKLAVASYLSGQSSPKYNSEPKMLAVSKTWVEYPLDTEGKLFLKMESGVKISNPEQVLEQLKTILNIQ